MGSLSFLRDEPPGVTVVTKVSTGNQDSKLKSLMYDESKANLTIPFPIPYETPYVKRAVEHAGKAGWGVVPTIKEALEKRMGLKEKVVSFREADILLRSGESMNNPLLISTFTNFDAMFVEDDSRFTRNVFVLRARYNKGMDWYNNKRPKCDDSNRIKGDRMITEIILQLNQLDLPPHDEEIGVGFHREFLKPEYLNWDQFQQQLAYCQKTRTAVERADMQALIDATTLNPVSSGN